MADDAGMTTGLTLPQALQVLGRYKAKLKEQSGTIAEGRKARAALQKQVEDLGKADRSGRVKELETEVRTLRHRGAFDRLAKARGAADEDLDDLFALSGYKAEGDAVDEKALGKLLDEQVAHPARKKYFAAAEGDAGDERPAPGAKEPPPDVGRGKRGDGKGTVYVTREQLADPKWALDPKNAEIRRTAKVRD